MRNYWCEGRDLNPHASYGASTSSSLTGSEPPKTPRKTMSQGLPKAPKSRPVGTAGTAKL